MIRLSMDITEEQAEAMIEEIDDLDDGERWEPEFSFTEKNAKLIRNKLHYQLEARSPRR